MDTILERFTRKILARAVLISVPVALLIVTADAFRAIHLELSGIDSRLLVYLPLGFLSGVLLFFWGWECFKLKKFIEDIPTSRIRSIAMGLVEVKGKTAAKFELKTPFSATTCVLYKYLKERLRVQHTSKGKHYRWETVDKGVSVTPFLLRDGPDTVLVEPHGVEIYADRRYHRCDGRFEGALRCSEWFILPGEEVYIMGKAGKSQEVHYERKARLMRKLEELKKDREKMKSLDSNGDGAIDAMEWEIAVRHIKEELKREELGKEFDDLADVSVAAGAEGEPFIISDRSEKALLSGLTVKSAAGVFGGSALAVGALLYFLNQTGVPLF